MIRHFRNYASAGVLGALLGLISFPLLTRALSVEDYGWLGLVSATLTVFVSLGKLGLQNALLRFFSEAQARGAQATRLLLSNTASATVLLSLLAVSLWLAASALILPRVQAAEGLQALFPIAAILVPVKIAHSMLSNLLQADEQSAVLGVLSVGEKLLRLVCLVLLLLSLGLSAARVLMVMVTAELIMLGVLLLRCRRYLAGIRLRMDAATLMPLLVYGVPAMSGELTAVMLETVDRYVIQWVMGGEALGHYAAAVNLCMYLEWVLILAFQSAVIPHYLQLYANSGRARTLAFLNTVLRYYTVVALGILAAFASAAPALVLLLAGERYREGLVVIPWIAAGYVLVGAISVAGAGVYVDKRPALLLKWALIALLLNLLLNLLLIPGLGLLGAGIATLMAMAVRSIGIYRDARLTLPVELPHSVMGSALVSCLLAYTAALLVTVDSAALEVLLKALVAAGSYAGVMLLWHPDLRHVLLARFQDWRG